jgi:hypothetical protein
VRVRLVIATSVAALATVGGFFCFVAKVIPGAYNFLSTVKMLRCCNAIKKHIVHDNNNICIVELCSL